jgi:quinol monooxygenase YgiN
MPVFVHNAANETLAQILMDVLGQSGRTWRTKPLTERTNAHWVVLPLMALMMFLMSHGAAFAQQGGMMVRIAEIQIDPACVKEYTAILKEEASDSVRLEPGVIAIFPMWQKEDPTKVKILEIYASRQAYDLHLASPHFQRYKTTTAKMVKALKLLEMEPMDRETMPSVFKKLAGGR